MIVRAPLWLVIVFVTAYNLLAYNLLFNLPTQAPHKAYRQ